MGLPLREEILEAVRRDNSTGASQPGLCGAETEQSASNLPRSIFEYGNLRPDIPDSTPLSSAVATKAWLPGSRLYSVTRGGVEHPAVRLDESGHAVLGYVMTAPRDMGITGLLEESVRRQYSPDHYDREIVEDGKRPTFITKRYPRQVVTERGQLVRCYVYHAPILSLANPVPTGDWCRRSNQ